MVILSTCNQDCVRQTSMDSVILSSFHATFTSRIQLRIVPFPIIVFVMLGKFRKTLLLTRQSDRSSEKQSVILLSPQLMSKNFVSGISILSIRTVNRLVDYVLSIIYGINLFYIFRFSWPLFTRNTVFTSSQTHKLVLILLAREVITSRSKFQISGWCVWFS